MATNSGGLQDRDQAGKMFQQFCKQAADPESGDVESGGGRERR
jgi:hypothetical protein